MAVAKRAGEASSFPEYFHVARDLPEETELQVHEDAVRTGKKSSTVDRSKACRVGGVVRRIDVRSSRLNLVQTGLLSDSVLGKGVLVAPEGEAGTISSHPPDATLLCRRREPVHTDTAVCHRVLSTPKSHSSSRGRLPTIARPGCEFMVPRSRSSPFFYHPHHGILRRIPYSRFTVPPARRLFS